LLAHFAGNAMPYFLCAHMPTLFHRNCVQYMGYLPLEKLLDVKIYFCHPYHSWEKGGVENANMEIRKFIPKGSDLSRCDKKFVRAIEEHLNGRFMKCLKYKTPEEKLNDHRKKTKNSFRSCKH
jgi:transposase, IS30 family